jgi:hypothetical protein
VSGVWRVGRVALERDDVVKQPQKDIAGRVEGVRRSLARIARYKGRGE